MEIQTTTVTTGDYGWKSWSNSYVISLKLTEESTDTAANTSLVSYRFTISNTNNNRFYAYNNSWTISVGGQEIAISRFDFDLGSNNTTQTIASGQVTVEHNADGTLLMPYHVSIPNILAWNENGPPAMALSGTWELTTIPRASGVSCPVCTIGSTVTVSVSKAGDGFTHTLEYSFGGLSGTIAEETGQTEVVWEVPSDFYSQIPSASRGYGSITCMTYSGGSLIGESECPLVADIDEEACRPEISAQIADVNDATIALSGDSGTLIRYYSDARVTAEYSAKNSAEVTDYTMVHNGEAYTGADVTVENVENGVFDFAVTDSRGLVTELSVTKPVVPYVKLTCNLGYDKPDTEGNMTLSVSGNYFNGSFGAADNSLSVVYRYKLSGTPWLDTPEEWQSLEPVITENGYVAHAALSGLDYQRAYTFQARAVDALDTANSPEYTARATPVFDWGERDFSVHGDLQVDGSVLLGNTPVLNTSRVQTLYRNVSGGVSIQSVADFMASCTEDFTFIVMLRGDAYPYVGMAVGMVCSNGQFGAATLYDYHNGVQSCRLFEGELIIL